MAPISGILQNINNINGEIMELDLVAESVDKQHLLVGECKWTDVIDSTQFCRNYPEKHNCCQL